MNDLKELMEKTKPIEDNDVVATIDMLPKETAIAMKNAESIGSVGRPETLEDTTYDMVSPDFVARFRAEYWQLLIRRKGLSKMLEAYKAKQLKFVPKCSYELLYRQLIHMNEYLADLEECAKVEGINL